MEYIIWISLVDKMRRRDLEEKKTLGSRNRILNKGNLDEASYWRLRLFGGKESLKIVLVYLMF